MRRLWQGLPVIVRAVLTGAVAAVAGTLPWALLVALNLRYWPAVPWAVPPIAIYLWLYWRYARGAGWPRSTQAGRRENSRANPLSEEVWGLALLAGVIGLVAVLLLQGVLGRLVSLPQQQDIDPSKYPPLTVLLWVLMSAAVAGITEEISFRGYMQRPIERRHGPLAAILTSGLLFGFLHFTHPEVTLVLLPFYVGVAAVYGMLAYLTDSILPGMLLHAGGNVLAAMAFFIGGRSEWQLAATPGPTILESGPDASFWLQLGAFIVVAAVAVRAYAALAKAARHSDAMAPRPRG